MKAGFQSIYISYENGRDTYSRCYTKPQEAVVALNFTREDILSEKERDGGGFLRDGKKPFLNVIFK